MNPTLAAPRGNTSRTVAIFASLWVLAVAQGIATNGGMLLFEVCGLLTLGAVTRVIVAETKSAGRTRLLSWSGLHFLAWLLWMLLMALAPLELEIWLRVSGHAS